MWRRACPHAACGRVPLRAVGWLNQAKGPTGRRRTDYGVDPYVLVISRVKRVRWGVLPSPPDGANGAATGIEHLARAARLNLPNGCSHSTGSGNNDQPGRERGSRPAVGHGASSTPAAGVSMSGSGTTSAGFSRRRPRQECHRPVLSSRKDANVDGSERGAQPGRRGWPQTTDVARFPRLLTGG